MPEGPEVRIIAEALHRLLAGQLIHRIRILSGPYLTNDNTHYAGTRGLLQQLGKHDHSTVGDIRVERVGVKGKYLYMRLSDSTHIFSHLAMTGTWRRSDPASPHTRLEIEYGSPARSLYYHDPRNMGKLYVETEPEATARLGALGPDVMGNDFTSEMFERIVTSRPHTLIGGLLMMQELLSGIGNYLRADVLWAAGICPFRACVELTRVEISALYVTIREMTHASYLAGGTTISDYRDPDGRVGRYRPVIYGRSVDPMGNPVITQELDARTLHWVPATQLTTMHLQLRALLGPRFLEEGMAIRAGWV
jgi:DNA-formamidopyrimidine glycosylase